MNGAEVNIILYADPVAKSKLRISINTTLKNKSTQMFLWLILYICVYFICCNAGEKTESALLMDLLGQYVKVIAQGL